jgi:hypothetical protein
MDSVQEPFDMPSYTEWMNSTKGSLFIIITQTKRKSNVDP